MANPRLPALVLVAGVLLLASCGSGLPDPVREGFQPAEDRPLTFDVAPRDTLSPAEALEDVQVFRHLVRNGYSGFETAEAAGSGALGRALDALVDGFGGRTEATSAADLEAALAASLTGIVDAHLALEGPRQYTFAARETLHFAPLEVEIRGGQYLTLGSLGVAPGTAYQDDPAFLFPSAPPGGNRFRVGIPSFQPLESATFRIGDRPRTFDLTIPNLAPAPGPDVDGARTPRTVYWALRSLDTSSRRVERALERFSESGQSSRDASTVVLDLRGNPGGSDAPWFQFLGQLYDTGAGALLRTVSMRDLVSSVTDQGSRYQAAGRPSNGRFEPAAGHRNEKSWSVYPGDPGPIARGPGAFRGRLVVVVDRQSASAAEGIIPVARRLGALVVGENTFGAIGFGNVFTYWLPHSGIRLFLPATVFVPPAGGPGYRGEGRGYAPDVWTASTADLRRVIVGLTGEPGEFFDPWLGSRP